MRSPSGPPEFNQRDWSQFDFSRWHVAGVAPEATSAAVADLAERLFSSEEWRGHFQATLPALREKVLGFHREHARQLQEAKIAAAREFEQRIAAVRKQSEEFGKTIDAAASPPLVQPAPHTFQVAVKVIAEKANVGLPGVIVRMAEPGHPEAVLVENITDLDGNAVLVVPRDKARERDKSDAALEVLGPGGHSLKQPADVVCIRLNQVETKVIAVRDTPDLEPQKKAALALRAQREARARNLSAKVDLLEQEQEARLRDLDRRLEETQKIIDALEHPAAPAPPSPAPAPPPTAPAPPRPAPAPPSAAPTPPRPAPAPEGAARPQAEASKQARPPQPKKGRKKP